jgi:hypothetical protein
MPFRYREAVFSLALGATRDIIKSRGADMTITTHPRRGLPVIASIATLIVLDGLGAEISRAEAAPKTLSLVGRYRLRFDRTVERKGMVSSADP